MLVLSYSQWCPPSFFHITHALSFWWGAKLCLKTIAWSSAPVLLQVSFRHRKQAQGGIFFSILSVAVLDEKLRVSQSFCASLSFQWSCPLMGVTRPGNLDKLPSGPVTVPTGFANGTDRSGPAKSIETDLCTWCTPEKIDGFCTMTAKTKVFVL